MPPEVPQIVRRMGQLPPPWDRSVVFFANLRSLFFGNEAQCEWLCQEIRGLSTYGGRLAPLLSLMYGGAHNALIVEAAPEPALMHYYRDQLGLVLPEIMVLSCERYHDLKPTDALFRRLQQHPAQWVEGYVTDHKLAELAEDLGKNITSTVAGSITGNNKLKLQQFLAEKGLPTFTTRTAKNIEEIKPALRALAKQGYHSAAIKAQIGASGIGIVKLPCEGADLTQIRASMFYEGEVMVQGWLDDAIPDIKSIGSPSVQLFVQDDTVYLYDLTEQLLSVDHLHQGNVAPPPCLKGCPELEEDLLQQTECIAGWLHRTGFRGTASVDFIVVRRAGVVEAYACEINARVTGATYPSMLARHFAPEQAWLMRNLRAHQPTASAELLAALHRAELLFYPGQERGVLPINFNTDENGLEFKGQFLCIAPTTEACYTLLQETDALDAANWTHARD